MIKEDNSLLGIISSIQIYFRVRDIAQDLKMNGIQLLTRLKEKIIVAKSPLIKFVIINNFL